MALTTLAIQPTFNNISGQIIVDDQTDYVGQGIPLDGTYTVRGFLAITLASATGTSTIYNNIGGATPDINPVSSTTSVLTIDLPKDSGGNILQGTYSIVYNVIVGDPDQVGVIVADVTEAFSYTYQQDLPTVCLTADVNCQGATITSYDSTDYGLYAIVSRTHNLYPPPATGATTITGTQASLSSGSPIYDKTWTQEVLSTVTYNLPDGLIAIVYVEGSREIPVVCDLGMSKIFCCLKKVFNRYNSLLAKNIVAANDMYIDTVKPMLEAMVMYNAAVAAGNTNGASYYYNLTVETSNCGEDCGCNSTEPQLIEPNIGSSNVTIVTSPDNSISVVPVVDGVTTTYQIQVSAALQQALAAIKNTVVTTATPTYLEVTSATVGNTTTYTVNYKPVGGLGYSTSMKRILIPSGTTGTSPSDYIAPTVAQVANIGANIVSPATSHTILLGQTVPNASTDTALITIGNVLVDGTLPYQVSAEVMGKYSSAVVGSLADLDVEVLYSNVSSGAVTLRLINPTSGNPYTLADLNTKGYGDIYVSLTINSQ
mgnify:CR=1 FL=1